MMGENWHVIKTQQMSPVVLDVSLPTCVHLIKYRQVASFRTIIALFCAVNITVVPPDNFPLIKLFYSCAVLRRSYFE